MIRPYYLADNRRIVYLSEKTGFRQLHVLDPRYESDMYLTRGHVEVYPIDITEDHNAMFVTATKEHPSRQDVYRVSLDDGAMTRLSHEDGYYSDVAVGPDGTKALANFTHYGAPKELVFIDANSREQKQLTDSHPPVAHELTKPRPEFFTYENRHGQTIHGWSFGGFQTQMCLYTEPDVFAAGIAGAGPTEWENYNSWYTSGTIGISEPGSAELKKFSLLPLAENLKAKLLLVHGMEDSNVLYQDTIRMYRELIKAGKEILVELFLDPTGGHGLGGDVKRLTRYRKYEEFLLRTVGSGK